MANQEHLAILKQGVEVWNQWRREHPEVKPDLISADLRKAALQGAYLRAVDFRNANLMEANLSGADLYDADLCVTDLTHADLSNASLLGARLLKTNLTNAILTNCSIYGISAWDVELQGATQFNLVITSDDEPTITVDNLKVAQFVYLLLRNQELREVIDTIAKKAVLILGRFTPERKAVLDAIRDELRKTDYLPIVFDFEKPSSRDFTETVSTLAHLARFIIADLTEPSSIPQELQAIVPDLEVPVVPLLEETKRAYALFVDFRKYPWVLPVYLYKDQPSLLAALKREIIDPAEKKARELAVEKAKRLEKPE